MGMKSFLGAGAGARPTVPTVVVAFMLTVGLLASVMAAEPDDDGSKAPPQAYLLPLDVQKLQETAQAELLKLRPELKAEDLKVDGLMYILRPSPDYEIHQQKDGTEKKVWLSNNYQELSVTFIILSTKRAGTAEDRNTIVHDTANIHFPNARYDKFSVSKGTSTEYRDFIVPKDHAPAPSTP